MNAISPILPSAAQHTRLLDVEGKDAPVVHADLRLAQGRDTSVAPDLNVEAILNVLPKYNNGSALSAKIQNLKDGNISRRDFYYSLTQKEFDGLVKAGIRIDIVTLRNSIASNNQKIINLEARTEDYARSGTNNDSHRREIVATQKEIVKLTRQNKILLDTLSVYGVDSARPLAKIFSTIAASPLNVGALSIITPKLEKAFGVK